MATSSTDAHAGRLVLIAGPSCVGKTPLLHALRRERPALVERLEPVVLYNDRTPRPGEVDGVDYHFRSRSHIESLDGNDRYVVMDVRGDLQALDVDTLEARLREGDALFEGNPYVAAAMLEHPRLKSTPTLSVFISPVARGEIEAMASSERIDAEATVTEVMRRKLLRRARQLKGELSRRDLDEVETRAGRAYHELRFATRFGYVIANHDGEDSENWETFPLVLGDARRAVWTVATLLEGGEAEGVEMWDGELFEAVEG